MSKTTFIVLILLSMNIHSAEKAKWISVGVGGDTLKIDSDISRDLREHSGYIGSSLNLAITPTKYFSVYSKYTDYSLVHRILDGMNLFKELFDDAWDGEDDEKPVYIRSKSIGASFRYPLKNDSYLGFLIEEHRWKISDRDDDPSPGVDNIDIYAKGKTTAHGIEFIKSHEHVSFGLGVKVFKKKPFKHSFFSSVNIKF